jgi:hypothetical protein
MPNGDMNGGFQGLKGQTYILSIWVWEHPDVLQQLQRVAGSPSERSFLYLSEESQVTGERLKRWFYRNEPELSKTLFERCPEGRWEDIDWHEMALYVWGTPERGEGS